MHRQLLVFCQLFLSSVNISHQCMPIVADGPEEVLVWYLKVRTLLNSKSKSQLSFHKKKKKKKKKIKRHGQTV